MRELKYGPTRLLATAVWLRLKCKYFNSGTAKEACTAFEVRAKQLFKLLLGKVYLGGAATKCPAQKEGPKSLLKKKKSVRAQSAIKEGNDNDGDDG